MNEIVRLGAVAAAIPLAALAALQAGPATGGAEGHATASRLEEFLGPPVFVAMQPLWKGRGGWGGTHQQGWHGGCVPVAWRWKMPCSCD